MEERSRARNNSVTTPHVHKTTVRTRQTLA